ncbi:MAG: CrcB family protein [Actinobacteria bacterium]|nr:CrcB family protein [Actinomycetota bacterium]
MTRRAHEIDGQAAAHPPIDPDLSHDASRRPLTVQCISAVFAGGVIGSFLRSLALTHVPVANALPWKLWLVNSSGAFALGLCATLIEAYRAQDRFRLFITAGILGGWTTYSSIAATVVQGGHHGYWLSAISYALVGLLMAIGAALLGRRVCLRVVRSAG